MNLSFSRVSASLEAPVWIGSAKVRIIFKPASFFVIFSQKSWKKSKNTLFRPKNRQNKALSGCEGRRLVCHLSLTSWTKRHAALLETWYPGYPCRNADDGNGGENMTKGNREMEKIFSDGRKNFGESLSIRSDTYIPVHIGTCWPLWGSQKWRKRYSHVRLPVVHADPYPHGVCTKIIIQILPA